MWQPHLTPASAVSCRVVGTGARIVVEECAGLRELLYANTGNAFNDAWLQQVRPLHRCLCHF